jgi:CDP-4-dehydro-6-deoxyglucose reductase/ferredoxin-NAD(P)+ reductase (naphthalene dioxygenase ferredoxin-specific)
VPKRYLAGNTRKPPSTPEKDSLGFKVTITNAGQTIDVDEGDPILDSAILAGIDFPSSCQSGNCGTCKVELVSGEVALEPYSDFALTDEERADGFILACRAIPKSDCEVTWDDPDDIEAHQRRWLTCKVDEIERVTHDIVRLRLTVVRGGQLIFSGGQYMSLKFGDMPARDFSPANCPDFEPLEFHVRRIDGGVVSQYVFEDLKVGDMVEAEGPFGVSHLRTGHRGPIVVVAGSTGLAPALSIVEAAIDWGMEQSIRLYYGARAERDLYDLKRLAELAANNDNVSIEIVLSEPDAPLAVGRREGLVTDAVAEDFKNPSSLDGAKAYIAGPPAMVEAAARLLETLGVRRRDCHADAFYTEADKAMLDS